MDQWKIILAALAIFCFVCGVELFAREKHPLRSGFGEILRGELALFAVAVSGIWTTVSLPLSLVTVGFAAAAGIPGVVSMLLVRLILPAA